MKRRLDRYAGLRSRLDRDRSDADIRDELAHHLESRIGEYEVAGLSRESAEREALRRMGDMERYAEETARVDAVRGRERRRRERLSGAVRELKRSVRSLTRSPWFTMAAVVTLGLGLGATGSVGTLLDRVVLRPLPYSQSEDLVWVASRVNGLGVNSQWGLSVAGYFDYRTQAGSLSDLGGFVGTAATVSGESAAERVPAALVTSSLQNVLRFRPVAGRLFTESDDVAGTARVVILSHSFWQRRFGGDAAIIGRTIDVNASATEVVGVLSPGDGLPDAEADIWLPVRFDPSAQPVNYHFVSAIGRLSDGATVTSAQLELDRFTARFPDAFPTAYSPSFMEEAQFRADVVPLRDQVLGDSARLLWILFGSVALVLVIACANVANLFMVRADVRRREAAVRSALGGGRADLAVHYMTESLVVALAAAALGVAMAWSIVSWLPGVAAGDIPRLAEVRFGATGIGVIGLTAVLAGVVFGTFPLLRMPHDSSALLRDGGRGVSGSRRQNAVRGVLVAGQIAVALTLLVGAGLMVRSYAKLRAVDPGLDPERVLTLEVSLPFRTYGTWESTYAFHRSLIDRATSLPGVESAATTTVLPLAGPGSCASMFIEDRPQDAASQPPCLLYRLVSPGWFDVMGINVEGRVPGWEDAEGGSGAIIVTAATARLLWPEGGALGRGARGNGDQPPFYRVSGVTGDIRGNGLDAPPTEEVYFPLLPMEGAPLWLPPRAFTLAIRTAGPDPLSVMPAVRSILAELDADVPIANVRTMEAVVAQSTARTAFTLLLLAFAAGMALVLSVVGLYGLVAYVVSQRRGEIGIRMALGAQPGQVTRMVVGRSLALAAAGIALGLILTFASVRVLRALLFDVSPTDPLTFAAVSLLLAALAVGASWGPARRASRVDPMEVMRVE
jgi:predicted permease